MIRAYPSRPSLFAGEKLKYHVSTTAPKFNVEIYRFGNQFGSFLERKVTIPTQKGKYVEDKSADVDWNWPLYEYPIPKDWPNGVYLACFFERDKDAPAGARPDALLGFDDTSHAISAHPTDHTKSWCCCARMLFVVKRPKDEPTPAKILYKVPVATYHAYNQCGSTWASLYNIQGNTSQRPPGFKVTMRRPGGGTGGIPHTATYPAMVGPNDNMYPPYMTFDRAEPHFIQWLHREGYVHDYCTDLDLHEDPKLLDPYRLLLSVGKDEYWSEDMRDHVETFIDRKGGNVAFFSGCTCWWRIQFVDNNTAIVCNKGPNGLLTGPDLWWKFRRNSPENALTGVSYRNGGQVLSGARLGYTVQKSYHWVYAGARLADGDIFGAEDALVGFECDGAAYVRDPAGLAVPAPAAAGGLVGGTPAQFVILGVAELPPVDPANPGERPQREPQAIDPHAGMMGIYNRGGVNIDTCMPPPDLRHTVFTAATTEWTRVLGIPLPPPPPQAVAHPPPPIHTITGNVIRTLSR